MFSFRDITTDDMYVVKDIYNSNKDFLTSHLNTTCISEQWCEQQFKEMQKALFACQFIVDELGEIVGFLEFKEGEETYISLLMIHNKYRNIGIGKQSYLCFEDRLKNSQCKTVRIDVVKKGNDSTLIFWENLGFVKVKEVTINWCNNNLLAIKMKRNL